MALSRRSSYKDLMAQANQAEETEKAAAENKRWFLQAAEEAKAREQEDERLCAEIRGRIADLRNQKEAKEVSIANSFATCSNAIKSHNFEARAETETLQARIKELQKECALIEVNRRSKVEEAGSICDADIKKYRSDISSLDTDITKAQAELQEYETLQVESADEEPAHGQPRTHDPGAANDVPPETSAHENFQNDTPKEVTRMQLSEELPETHHPRQPSTVESVHYDNVDDNSHNIAVTEVSAKPTTQETVSLTQQTPDSAAEEGDDEDEDDDPVRPWPRRLGSQGNREKGNSAKNQEKKRRTSTGQEQSAHLNWLTSAKDRTVEATPTMLQGQEIEEHSFSADFPMIVFLNDRWHEMKCYVCLSNRSVDDTGKFFNGIRGLLGHFTQCHGSTSRADIIGQCIARTFSAAEIRALRSGIQPHPPIELSFGDTARRNERVTPKCTPSKGPNEEYPGASKGGAEIYHAEASTDSRESCQQTVESPEIVPNLAGAQSIDEAFPDVNVSGESASNSRLSNGGEPASMTPNSSKYKHDGPKVEPQSISNSEMPRANSSSNPSSSMSPPVVPSEGPKSPAEHCRSAKSDEVTPGAFSGRREKSTATFNVLETQPSTHEIIGRSAPGEPAQALSVVPSAYPEATRSLSCSRPAGPENGETTSTDKSAHVQAPPTKLSSPNLNVLHIRYPNTMHINGSWCLIRCKTCHANAARVSRGEPIFFWGIEGLQKHVREAHDLEAEYRDMEEWCEFSEIPQLDVHRLSKDKKDLGILNEPFVGHAVNAPPSSTFRATAQRQDLSEGIFRDPRLRGRQPTTGLRLGTKVPAVPSPRSASTPTDGHPGLRGPSRPPSHPPRGTFHTPVGTQRHTTPFVPRQRAKSSPPPRERLNTLSGARDTSRSPPYKKQKQREKELEGGSFFKRFGSPADGNTENRDSPR
ncbi:hypothetical protein AC578_4985 [Pseudocercospora eumusae]|uniref:Uncharacterized protein n=1 Tax=Pseudocercospora eumusae TaxID=321146 RepID=A0A139H943_9PEZI|nr:hypothetical protein AC578_4985 [Pseudocercospora eumusae]